MCVVGWKLFEELLIDRGEIYNSEVLLILYVLFVVTELHPHTIFFQHFPT